MAEALAAGSEGGEAVAATTPGEHLDLTIEETWERSGRMGRRQGAPKTHSALQQFPSLTAAWQDVHCTRGRRQYSVDGAGWLSSRSDDGGTATEPEEDLAELLAGVVLARGCQRMSERKRPG